MDRVGATAARPLSTPGPRWLILVMARGTVACGAAAPCCRTCSVTRTLDLMRRFPLLLALCCLPLVVGCEGCRSDPEQPEDKQVAPVEDFTSREAMAFPADAAFANNAIKPGHWFTASQSLKSNKADARGVLQSTNSMRGSNVEAGTTEVVEGELMTVRPIVLPKGQQRRFDFRLLAPTGGTKDQNRMYVSSRFISSGRTLYHDTGNVPFNVLAGREYFFVVLTGRAERFAKFQVSDWVRPFKDQYAFKQRPPHYRIVFPPTKNLLPLSESMLDWTATAVVCWDDIPPEALTPVQQQALADWLRFGGTLIVNGADASDAIMQTALADVLPLRPTGNIQLDPDAAGELLKRWSVDGDRTTEKQIALLREQEGRVAVDGQKSDDAVEVEGTSNLVLVRRVGLGRVVQARFDITSDWMVTWESYDSFVNAVMLARPRREFSRNFDVSQDSTLKQAFPDYPLASSDPALNSRLRITARDAVLPAESTPRTRSAASSSRLDPLTLADTRSGVCGWTNDSDTLWHCLRILGEESGIEIPDSSLVVRSLGYYLLILVPINYLVFRLVGRLEYAWLAVPLIAIGGAVWVARAARLDIGFARKQTELAVLELQPDYHRGHLTRVIAIYNSLSSSYELQFDSVEAVAVPIADRQWHRRYPISRHPLRQDRPSRDWRLRVTRRGWFTPKR